VCNVVCAVDVIEHDDPKGVGSYDISNEVHRHLVVAQRDGFTGIMIASADTKAHGDGTHAKDGRHYMK
jgi:hypothetical protein